MLPVKWMLYVLMFGLVWKTCVKLEYKARFVTPSGLIEHPLRQQSTRLLHLESSLLPVYSRILLLIADRSILLKTEDHPVFVTSFCRLSRFTV